MKIWVERPDGNGESPAGRAAPVWEVTLTDAPRVCERYGRDLRKLEGGQSAACAESVRLLVAEIMADPRNAIAVAGYYDARAIVAMLTGLFFNLREYPEGTVRVLQ